MVASVGSKTNTLVLVERFLGGREFCIAVMGAGPAGAFAFSPVERHLEADEKVGGWGGRDVVEKGVGQLVGYSSGRSVQHNSLLCWYHSKWFPSMFVLVVGNNS